MSNFDDPRALERALVTMVQGIIGNASPAGIVTPKAVVNAAATAAAATTTGVVKELDLRDPPTVLRWLKTTKKQIAPHADKIPLPIVQGIAKTIFPPAQAVVPVIRYLQSPASSKTAPSAAALTTLAPPGTSQQQIYIIPIVQSPPAPHPQVRAMQRTARDIGVWAQRNPVLTLGLAYAVYRARGVPGQVVRALDRAINALCAWLWASARRSTRKRGLWASERLEAMKEKAQGYALSLLPPSAAAVADDGPVDGEGRVRLDIGDALWVVITAIVAVYVTVNRKKIFKRK